MMHNQIAPGFAAVALFHDWLHPMWPTLLVAMSAGVVPDNNIRFTKSGRLLLVWWFRGVRQ